MYMHSSSYDIDVSSETFVIFLEANSESLVSLTMYHVGINWNTMLVEEIDSGGEIYALKHFSVNR